MTAYRARIALAALSGLAFATAVAGCSTEQPAAHVHHRALGVATAQPDTSASPTPAPTTVATSAPKTVAKPPAPAPVHHVAAPLPKPKPKPNPPAVVTYRNGNYTAQGNYLSPGGTETMQVALTLSNGIVTALDVTSVKVDPTAAGYEAQFEAGVNAVAVGRPIATLHVGAVGGSSLTSLGFNQAIATIKAQAKN